MKTIEEASMEAISDRTISVEELFKAGVEFVQQWIPVEDELPEENIPVLVKMDYYYAFTSIQAIDICVFRYSQWINALRNQHSNGSVMAWRPIEYK